MKQFLSPTATFAMMTSSALADDHNYTCPMHPEIVRDERGQCPICGMGFVAVSTKSDEEFHDAHS